MNLEHAQTAMKIILHAGDAREKTMNALKALDKLKNGAEKFQKDYTGKLKGFCRLFSEPRKDKDNLPKRAFRCREYSRW